MSDYEVLASPVSPICVFVFSSCWVMSNCVSLPMRLSGLMVAMMSFCVPAVCPSIDFLFPRLKDIFVCVCIIQ